MLLPLAPEKKLNALIGKSKVKLKDRFWQSPASKVFKRVSENLSMSSSDRIGHSKFLKQKEFKIKRAIFVNAFKVKLDFLEKLLLAQRRSIKELINTEVKW